MKKITNLLMVLMLAMTSSIYAQTITGTVNAEDGPLPGANVIVKGTTNGTTTDFDGKFTLDVSEGSGAVVISFIGYANKEVKYTVAAGETKNLGTITLVSDNTLEEVVVVGRGIVDLATGRSTPIAVSTIGAAEIQAKAVGNVEFPEVMKNTPSVYVSNQAGGFGDSQVFLRGFDQVNTAFLLNGQPINGMEDGRMYWSNWSGMTDIANTVQVQRGLGASKLAISSVGGTVNIVSKTVDKEEGGFFRTLVANDSYFKNTIAYNSGLKGKWAFSILVDHWQGHRKWARGTSGQGQNYFFSVGYVPNEKHTINFLITGAPQYHDQNFSEGDLDVYEQYGSKYNGNYGFRDGDALTWRRNYYHKPVANLNWDWNISDNTALSTVLYASWGRGGGTGPVGRQTGFINDDNGEVDFDAIVANNIANADENNYGSFGSSGMIRASVNNHNWYGALTNFNYDINEEWTFNVGADIRLYKGDHFRQFIDFLGIDGYTDNFRHFDRPSDYAITETYEADPWASLFNYADSDQRYDRDYSEWINYQGVFGQVEYKSEGGFSAFIQGAVSNQSYEREERFTADGEKSPKLNKGGYNIKGGLAYKINDNHTIFGNAGQYSRQPFLDNVFVDVIRGNDLVDPEVENEEINSIEFGYKFVGNNLRINFNIYQSKWANRFLGASGSEIIDGLDTDTFTRYTDITQVHKGAELDLRYKPNGSFTLRWYGSYGDWTYDGTTPFITRDDQGITIREGNLDLTGTYIGNAPQVSTGFGFKYDVTDAFSFDADANVYSNLYGFVDPEDVVDAANSGEVYQAERLNSYSLVDLGLSYKFTFGDNNLKLRGNVYNVFNAAYVNQKNAFGYYLGVGRTWNLSARYNF